MTEIGSEEMGKEDMPIKLKK